MEDRIEVGIELVGSEVKSLREGRMSLNESYAMFKHNELYLINSHIPEYQPAGQFNHKPKRDRKLLLHKKELLKFQGMLSQKGYTLIPTKCYFKNGKAKIELALARGKRKYDKREAIKKDIQRREMRKVSR